MPMGGEKRKNPMVW